MKKDIHPNYREIAVQDLSSDGFIFITRSTVNTREKITIDGKEYPLLKVETSAETHPFYTGTQKILDTGGRIEKFKAKFAKFSRPSGAAKAE
jgi:large subunit ribosomal protein L31